MIIKRRKHNLPGLNTTSTADISFMLLIFFLVTSSMNVDKGLKRKLPPVERQETIDETQIVKEKVLKLTIDANNHLFVNDSQTLVKQLRLVAFDFIVKRGDDHLITLNVSPNSSYDEYFQVQNSLVMAYRDVRDAYAMKHFHKKYDQCNRQQREQANEACRQHIAEDYGSQSEKGGANADV